MSAKKSWSVGAKIWLLSGALLLNLGIVGGVGVWESSKISAQLTEVAQVHLPAVRFMTLADMMHDGIRANVFRSIISSGSKNKEELEDVKKESKEFAENINNYLASLKKLDLPAPTQKAIDAVLPDVEVYVKSAGDIVETALSGNVKGAIEKLPAFSQKFEVLEKSMGVLGDLIEKDSQVARAEGEKLAASANWIGLMLICFGFTTGLVSAFFFIRSLQRTLRDVIRELVGNSEQVGSSASSLRVASQNLSDSSTKQASALQETASCVDEITAMVNKTAENSKHLEKTAKETNDSALKGREAVKEMLEAVQAIRTSQDSINQQVEQGNEKITEIVKVISEIENKTKVINDIVFQTKLLSFNASVEAARAGEHGKGFAVVAEEVGNLAQMSGNAAREISEMLSTSVSKVGGIVNENRRAVETLIEGGREKIGVGTKVVEQCGAALDDIVKYVSQESVMINEITIAIQEQNQGIQEISRAIQMLDDSTQKNSAMSTETAGLSNSLLGQSESLSDVVGKMKQLVAIQQQQPEASVVEATAAPASEDHVNKAA